MVEPMGQQQSTRAERKERTRRALLDGTLDLLADRNFSGLSLREVSRAAGIVPTAFYRHFASLDDLGVALVEEVMRTARGLLREARREGGDAGLTIDSALALLERRVRGHPREFRFLLRERHGGTAEIRRAIDTELRLLTGELSIGLARVGALAAWESEDLETAAGLLVNVALDAVPALVEAPGRGVGEALTRTGRQLRIVALGMGAWTPEG